MQWSSLAVLSLIAAEAHGFASAPMLRFACSQLVVQRLDPLVNPGVVPTPHLHQIVGGNSLKPYMDPSLDPSALSTCTTCTFSEDFSNYWTAVLYFRARNGTFHRVLQIGKQFLESANGGITVYYILPYDGKTKVTAFKQGFRMIVGDPMVREDKNTSESRSMSYRCFERNWGQMDTYPGGGNDTRALPKYPCPGGIRVNKFFPTCCA